MQSVLENLEINKVKLTLTVSPEKFEEGMKHAYNKNKGKLNLPGFRPGKAPRKLIEVQYGKEVFYDDAIDFVLPQAYEDAVEEHNLDVVSRPEINVTEASSEKGAVIECTVYTRPEAKVMDYTGIEFIETEVTVSEDEINAEINKSREKNARITNVTNRAVEMNDKVNIDFEGFIDGVAFDGGKAAGHDLLIGSHSFIDTFEEQLIGKSIGDETEIHINFPEDYRAEELKGKPAVFKVKINAIEYKELPDLDDDFAQDVSDFDTFEEYKNDIKAKILHDKEHAAEHAKEDMIIGGLIDRTIVELPQPMIEQQVDSMVRDFAERVKQTGLTVEAYLGYTQTTMDSLRKTYAVQAERNIKARLALEAVVRNAGIEATEAEIDEELSKISGAYGIEKEKLASVMSEREKESVAKDVRVQKALKLVTENAVLKK